VKSGTQKGGQALSQGRKDAMCQVLGARTQLEHREKLRARIEGHPQPHHLVRATPSGAQFLQLQVREPERAQAALVQGLGVLACTSQKGW
jgi:hypothetical protein